MGTDYFCVRLCIGGDGVHYCYQSYAEVRIETLMSAELLLDSWIHKDEYCKDINFTKENPDVNLEFDNPNNFQKCFIFICEYSKMNKEKMQKALTHCVHMWALNCCSHLIDKTYKKDELDRYEYLTAVVNGVRNYESDRDADIFDCININNPLKSAHTLEKYLFNKIVDAIFINPWEYNGVSKVDSSLEELLNGSNISPEVVMAIQDCIYIKEVLSYRKGYNNGKSVGYKIGSENGRKDGLKEGKKAGYRKGYNDGIYWYSN